MQPLANRLCSIIERMFQSAFPNYGHAPSQIEQNIHMLSVAIDVLLKFMSPELFVGLRGCCVSAALMSVPEAAVHKNHSLVFGKHKVGRAGQFSHMKSITESSGKKAGAKCPFRPSIFSANTRHHAAALRSGGDTHSPKGMFQEIV